MDKDIKKMVRLANLKFSPDQMDKFSAKVKSVLAYVEELNELDTSGLEPTSHAVDSGAHLRDDLAAASGMAAEILAIAPARDGEFIKVPKVIDSE